MLAQRVVRPSIAMCRFKNRDVVHPFVAFVILVHRYARIKEVQGPCEAWGFWWLRGRRSALPCRELHRGCRLRYYARLGTLGGDGGLDIRVIREVLKRRVDHRTSQ